MPPSFHHSSGRRDSLEELALRVNIAAHFPTAPRFHLWNPVVSAPAVRAIFPMPRRKTLGRRDTRGVFPPSSRHKPRKGERDIRPTIDRVLIVENPRIGAALHLYNEILLHNRSLADPICESAIQINPVVVLPAHRCHRAPRGKEVIGENFRSASFMEIRGDRSSHGSLSV